jgi:hypothetical protein
MILAAVLAITGCGSGRKAPPKMALAPRYPKLPEKKVPAVFTDTVLQRCDLMNAQPFAVSGYGLVKGLHDTGDTFAATNIREYIRRQMITHGFGSSLSRYGTVQPEDVLKSPTVAIVRVDAFLPPGGRKGQSMDVFISALDGNNTTSLAHGVLYRTDLKFQGANPLQPGYTIDVLAQGEGPIFVNPAYALSEPGTNPEARSSLRQGMVLAGGVMSIDRAIVLRLRTPQLSMARAIEFRIDQAFQNTSVASAKDEAMIALLVPPEYGEDWEHFVQVVTHLFFNPSPDFAAAKARQLAEEAVKDDAPLLDISYCWEALGTPALPFMTPLMGNPKPDVAFAAARAAAFLKDQTAQTVLMGMARDNNHPFQLNAVQTLAKLPESPVVSQTLRSLMLTGQTTVRIEAYKALAKQNDTSIMSIQIPRPDGRLSFVLDVIRGDCPPLLYATRTGVPRLALFGNDPRLNLPVLLTAMQNQLSISSESTRPYLTVYYRGQDVEKPLSFTSSPELPELISRLGGQGAPLQRLSFNYCDVVSVVQLMSDQQRLSALQSGRRVPIPFVMEEAPQTQRAIENAPPIPESPAIPENESVGAAGPQPGATP